MKSEPWAQAPQYVYVKKKKKTTLASSLWANLSPGAVTQCSQLVPGAFRSFQQETHRPGALRPDICRWWILLGPALLLIPTDTSSVSFCLLQPKWDRHKAP